MKIKVGSTNKIKIEAVEEILEDYPHLKDAEISSVETDSAVSDQPKSLEETVRGAVNRAKGAFKDCKYSIGLESGLMEVPNCSKTGYMDVCVCAIYDGSESHLGLSSAWEVPKNVMCHINDGHNMTEASVKAGLTQNEKLGAAEGLIGIMTKGRLTRKDYTKEALRTALIHLEP